MTIESIMKQFMQQFSFGETIHFRVLTETGGNPDLCIPGEIVIVDYLPDTIPRVMRLTREQILSGDSALGDFKVVLLYGGEVTAAVAGQAAGIVIGGTRAAGQVTGGKYCPIRKETIVQLYLDGNVSSGMEFNCGFEGGD